MDEIEAGTKTFHELVRSLDADVQAVVPVKPTNSMFLISLTKGTNRKFITIPEDDLLELPHERDILSKVTKIVKDAIAAL